MLKQGFIGRFRETDVTGGEADFHVFSREKIEGRASNLDGQYCKDGFKDLQM